MIAQSQSGTGKTAAFVLTMLSRVDGSQKCCQVLGLKICFIESCFRIGVHERQIIVFIVAPWFFQCICLSPTYELALQTAEVTKQMAKFMPDIEICLAVRGERRCRFLIKLSIEIDVVLIIIDCLFLCWAVERGQKVAAQIVIGTPGTVLDWAMKLKVFDMKKIRVFVLDEADVMIGIQGHQDQSIRLQRYCNHVSAAWPSHKFVLIG